MIRAYDKNYFEKARVTLGNMLDFAVNTLGIDLVKFWTMFIVSDISKKFAKGDSAVIVGKSGIELAYDVIGNADDRDLSAASTEDKSPEYWTGWALAYYQWLKNYSFAKIERIISIDLIREMYFPYHEMDIQQFCDRLNEIESNSHNDTNLKRFRKLCGLTQKQLAEETGIPIRTIQQYEQGQKRIDGARTEYTIALSKVLYCSPEELLDT